MPHRFRHAAFYTVLVLVVAACSTAAAIEDRPVWSDHIVSTDNEPTAMAGERRIASQVTTRPSQPTKPYTWEQGERPVDIKASAGGSLICLLTRVAGDFKSSGGWVRLWSADKGHSWTLEGSPGQNSLSANAYCFSPGEVRPPSDNWDLQDEIWVPSGTGLSCKPGPTRVDVKAGSWATFLSGMSGVFEGGGEWIEVERSPPKLAAHACGDGVHTKANAVSFYVGESLAARFTNESGYRVHAGGGETQEERMELVSEAVCGFTKIGGKFNGHDDFIQISEKDGYWFLRAHSVPSDGVTAVAKCYSRQQG